MIDITNIRNQILEQGFSKKNTIEMTGVGGTLLHSQIDYLLKNVPLNPKYQPELDDIQQWYETHYPLYNEPEYRRRQVYFNNVNYDERFQCISLFQIIDNEMIVYQRSSHTIKMLDDFRFFAEIVNRWFWNVVYIKISYGSLHTENIEND